MHLAIRIRKRKANPSKPDLGTQLLPLSECFCSEYSFGVLVSLDSYFVIRKIGVHGGNRVLPHVASHTVLL
jgi:hypothetical protein